MIVSYLTLEYFEWGKIFLESLKLSGYEGRVVLHTRELTQKHYDELRSIYQRVSMRGSYMDWEWLSVKYGVSIKEIKKSRDDVAKGKLNGNHRLWMDITSVCDRMASFYKHMKAYSNCALKDPFLFFDIDVLFRKSINWLIDGAKEFGVCLIVRGRDNIADPKIAGGLFIMNGQEGLWFLGECCNVINDIPVWYRVPQPFQQIAMNQVFSSCENYLNWKGLPYGQECEIDSTLGKNASIWLFKSKKKLESLDVAKLELRRLRCSE